MSSCTCPGSRGDPGCAQAMWEGLQNGHNWACAAQGFLQRALTDIWRAPVQAPWEAYAELVESGQEFTIGGLRLAEGAPDPAQTLRMTFRWVAGCRPGGVRASIMRQMQLLQSRLNVPCAKAAAAHDLREAW